MSSAEVACEINRSCSH